MSASDAPLARLFSDVAKAVSAAQEELDVEANASPGDLPLPPLAFIVSQTKVTLAGNLALAPGDVVGESSGGLSFALSNRIQSTLQSAGDSAKSSRISLSIEAVPRSNDT